MFDEGPRRVISGFGGKTKGEGTKAESANEGVGSEGFCGRIRRLHGLSQIVFGVYCPFVSWYYWGSVFGLPRPATHLL